jgi:hypothetical protein
MGGQRSKACHDIAKDIWLFAEAKDLCWPRHTSQANATKWQMLSHVYSMVPQNGVGCCYIPAHSALLSVRPSTGSFRVPLE